MSGPLDSVLERHVDQVLRASDGGSTKIIFELDGSQAVASFPVRIVNGHIELRQATLTTAGKTGNLTRLAAAPAGAAYRCF